MANFKRTYINADEELVIQGKLTIEGELEQKEFVETSSFSQTNFNGDVLVVNADGFTKAVSPIATNSELKLRSGDANASLLFNSIAGTLTLSASPAITTTLTVDGDISATDITASGTFTGALSGNATSATTATTLATARNFSITGDVQASAVTFNGGADVVLSSALATVNSNVGTFGTATTIPQVTVNAKGLTTGATNVAIAIPHTQITDFDAEVRALVSVTDAGGDGSLAYSAGVITYTGPSAAEVRAHLSGGAGLTYSSGAFAVGAGDGIDVNADDIDVDSTVVRTSGTQIIAGDKTFTGSVVVPALTMPSASGGNYVAGDNTTKSASTAYVETAIISLIDGAPGTLNTLNEIAAALNDAPGIGGIVTSNTTRITTLEGRDLIAGAGLTGGGTLAADRTFNVIGGTGITANANDIEIDTTVVVDIPTTQTISGDKTFSGTTTFSDALIIPASATATNGAIYVNNSTSKAYVYVAGVIKEITPAVDAGDVEDVGSTGTDIYAGSRTSGSTTFHGIKSLAGGTGVTLADSGNVITVATTITQYTEALVRADVSVTDAGGDGSLAYNSSTGVFTYTGPSAAEVRAHFSAGTGISIASGAISTTADNYSSFTVQTDTGAGGAEAISSGETLTFVGGTNTTITNSGNTITIRNDNDADIEAVTAGDGLSGGGSSGSVTLALDLNELTAAVVDVANDSIAIVDANDSNASRKETIADLVTAMAGTNLTATNGVLSSTADIEAVTAGDGLSGGGNSGAISLALDLNELTAAVVDVTADSIAIIDAGAGASSKKESIADLVAGIAGTGLTAASGVLSLTDTGYITGVTAGTGLTGGGTSGTVSLAVSGLTVAEIAAGSLQLGSESFSDSDSVLMTAAAVQDKILSYSYTTETGDITAVVAGTGLTGGATSGSATLNVNTGAVSNGASTIPTGDQVYDFVIGLGYTTEVGDITGVTAGTGLSGGGTSGAVTLNVSGLTISELAAGSLQLGSESFSDNDTSLMTSAAIQDKITSYGYSTTTGDITNVAVAGTGLSGGGSSGAVTITSNATSANTASTIVARDASGNFSAGTITATATQAQYADLAENYSADADYEVGTVVVIGGEQEITITSEVNSTKVAGVISSNPAYLMNAGCGGDYPKSVALRGRIPVKVIGVVQKGDVLVTSDTPGFAMSALYPHDVSASEIVGKALESKLTAEGGVIEALI